MKIIQKLFAFNQNILYINNSLMERGYQIKAPLPQSNNPNQKVQLWQL